METTVIELGQDEVGFSIAGVSNLSPVALNTVFPLFDPGLFNGTVPRFDLFSFQVHFWAAGVIAAMTFARIDIAYASDDINGAPWWTAGVFQLNGTGDVTPYVSGLIVAPRRGPPGDDLEAQIVVDALPAGATNFRWGISGRGWWRK